jgi:hypothetical protein
LFETRNDNRDALSMYEQKTKQDDMRRKQREKELLERECQKCGDFLLSESNGIRLPPIRIQSCRHVFCSACAQQCLRVHRKCPKCQCSTKKSDVNNVDSKLWEQLMNVSNQIYSISSVPPFAVPTIVLEIGNTAKNTGIGGGRNGGDKVTMNTYVKVVTSTESSIIKSVAFNINPSYKKPTVVLKAPNGERGCYTLERTLGFSFPCNATIHFTQSSIAPIHFKYHTQMKASKYSVRIAIVDTTGGVSKKTESNQSKRRKGSSSEVVYDANIGDGWIFNGGCEEKNKCVYNSV